MTTDVPLRCRCGQVRGVAAGVSASTGNRMICYCDDCQAFARFLEHDAMLDAHGGTDIYQMAPGRLRITDGRGELACVRLGPNGMHRFYARCCRTPIANTRPSLPFVGVHAPFMELGARDEVLGPPTGYAHEKFAIGGPPPHPPGKSLPGIVLRVIVLMLGWIARGVARPSPFFDGKKRPMMEPKVLSVSERAKLQPSS